MVVEDMSFIRGVHATCRRDHYLLGLFSPLALAETDPRSASVFVDEFDAGSFEGLPHKN